MATYLFTWNPARWNWASIDDDLATYRRLGFFEDSWSCGVTKKIRPGDRAFLIRLGSEPPTGIMASGSVLTSPYSAAHFSDPSRSANYINLRYDLLLDPRIEPLLTRDRLKQELPTGQWSPQASGTTIPSDVAVALEDMWCEHITTAGLLADEVVTPELYWEGSVRQVSVNSYERDPQARKACLAHHGRQCIVCGFNFGITYGDLGKGFIHVHHLDPLSEIGKEYQIDPISKMVPVCPNCHAMLHRRTPPFTPDDLRAKMLVQGDRPAITPRPSSLHQVDGAL